MIIEQQKKAKEMAMGSVVSLSFLRKFIWIWNTDQLVRMPLQAPQTKRYVVKGGPARVVRQEESSRVGGLWSLIFLLR